MLVAERMAKLDVLILRKETADVSRELMKFGEFQVIEIAGDKVKDYSLAKIGGGEKINALQEMERKTHFLLSAFETFDLKQQIQEDMASEGLSEEDLTSGGLFSPDEIEKNLKDIEDEFNQYNVETERVARRKTDTEIKMLKVNYFSNMNIDWDKLDSLKYVYFGFGIIPHSSFQGFLSAVSEIPRMVHQVVGEKGQDIIVFFAVSRAEKEHIDHILKNVYYRDYGMPAGLGLEGGLQSKMVKYAFEYSTVHDDEIWLERRFHKMSAKFIPELLSLRKSILYHTGVAKLEGEMASSASSLLFSGWVPEKVVGKLKARIEKITAKKCCFFEQNASEAFENEGLVPPTKLSNPAILRPFEFLVNTYGTPSYKEVDPTLFAAISYMIMYGAMFGDMGHGLILALMGGLLMLYRKSKLIANFGAIMLGVGLSAMLFGLLYGELFGLGKHNGGPITALWMSPSEPDNVMKILLVSVCFGVLLLSVGMFLNIVNSFRNKNYGRMLFSSYGAAGIAFYWSVLGLGVMTFLRMHLTPWLWLVPAAAFLVFVFEKQLEKLFFPHGHHEKQAAIVVGFEVFESLMKFLSNTVSFMRMGAFALNHSALMGVVFLIAGKPEGNPVGFWIAILIGNLFVMGLEGFIVAIQALRLEYYEFFTKFFRGGGKRFEGIGIYGKSQG